MKIKFFAVAMVLLVTVVLTGCTNQASNQSAVYSEAAQLLTEVKTTQFFTGESVSEEDVTKILSAGVNAPSAMNTQPWHFTAVTDTQVAKQLADAMGSMKPPAMNGDMPDMPKPENLPEGAELMMDSAKNAPAIPEGMQPPEGAPADAPKPPEGGAGFAKMPNKAGIGDAPLTIVISCKEGSELDCGLAVQNMSAEAQLLGYGTKIMTAPAMSLNTEEYKQLLSIPEGQKIAAVLIVGKPATEADNPDAVTAATERNAFYDMVTVIGQ